jgi:hypothetical protein
MQQGGAAACSSNGWVVGWASIIYIYISSSSSSSRHRHHQPTCAADRWRVAEDVLDDDGAGGVPPSGSHSVTRVVCCWCREDLSVVLKVSGLFNSWRGAKLLLLFQNFNDLWRKGHGLCFVCPPTCGTTAGTQYRHAVERGVGAGRWRAAMLGLSELKARRLQIFSFTRKGKPYVSRSGARVLLCSHNRVSLRDVARSNFTKGYLVVKSRGPLRVNWKGVWIHAAKQVRSQPKSWRLGL